MNTAQESQPFESSGIMASTIEICCEAGCSGGEGDGGEDDEEVSRYSDLSRY